MDDIWGNNFHGHRKPDETGHLGRLLGIDGKMAGQDMKTIGLEDVLGLDLADLEPARAPAAGDNPLHPAPVNREPGDQAGRPPFPDSILVHGPKRSHGPLG